LTTTGGLGLDHIGDARRAIIHAVKTKKNLHSAYMDRNPVTEIRQGAGKFLIKLVAGAGFEPATFGL
jgi:hypothetical protein